MDNSVLIKYYEDNIRKGYTIEQISTNLRNNGYPEETIQQTVASLSAEHHQASQQNPEKFDYSKLPDKIKRHIEPQAAQQKAGNNLQEGSGNQQMDAGTKDWQREQSQSIQNPPIEKHEGLDQASLIKYGSILGSVLLIIIITALALGSSGEDPNDVIEDVDRIGGDTDATNLEDRSRPDNEMTAEEENPQHESKGDEEEVQETKILDDEIQTICEDYDCLIQKASSCDPVRANITKTESMQGLISTSLMTIDIRKYEQGCIYTTTLESFDLGFTDEMRALLRERNMTDADIDAELARAQNNSMLQSIELGRDVHCLFDSEDQILKILQETKNNLTNTSNGYVCEATEEEIETLIALPDYDEENLRAKMEEGICFTMGYYKDAVCIPEEQGRKPAELFESINTHMTETDTETERQNNSADQNEMPLDVEEEEEEEEFELTSGQVCNTNMDCADGKRETRNLCEEGQCIVRLSHTDCEDGDDYCPSSCYGTNDTDCVDNLGRRLCETHSHCDDDNELTEDICDDDNGYCLYFDQEAPNHPPTINSTPETLQAFAGEEYTYQVNASDEDGHEIDFSLSGEPSNMSINESGFLTWTPAEDDYSSGNVSIVVTDEEDGETEQHIEIVVFISEEDDTYKQQCEDDKDCYMNVVIINEDYMMCKYIGRYWDDPDYVDRDDCLYLIADNLNSNEPCEYIHDAGIRSQCENI
ncbi:MAG: Ig-like domain-containing protein [Nanoarchaeota archaeon]